MGREVRRVPKDWQHPKDERGRLKPLFDGYSEDVRAWDEGAAMWAKGMVRDWSNGGWKQRGDGVQSETYEEWDGERPSRSDYMPEWPAAERTHLMMYETTSEGTPISPAFETAEELAHWLADTGASAFGSMTATCEEWLAMFGHGSTVSAAMIDGQMVSGVASVADEVGKGGGKKEPTDA